MLSNSFLKTYKHDPELKRVVDKVQDLVSTKQIGDILNADYFRGLKEADFLTQAALTLMEEAEILSQLDAFTCPNESCGNTLIEKEQLYCEDCDQYIDFDHARPKCFYKVEKSTTRTSDEVRRDAAYFDTNFVDPITGGTIVGHREVNCVYLRTELAVGPNGKSILHGNEILNLSSGRFQPEYGKNRRSFVYQYELKNRGVYVSNSVNFNGGTNFVGDISQTTNLYGEEVLKKEFSDLMTHMLSTLADNNIKDREIIGILEDGLSSKRDWKSKFQTLNKIVGHMANYSTLLTPFLPKIMSLIEAIPRS